MEDELKKEHLLNSLLGFHTTNREEEPLIALSKEGIERSLQYRKEHPSPPLIEHKTQLSDTKKAHLRFQQNCRASKLLGLACGELPPQKIPKLPKRPDWNDEEEWPEASDASASPEQPAEAMPDGMESDPLASTSLESDSLESDPLVAAEEQGPEGEARSEQADS